MKTSDNWSNSLTIRPSQGRSTAGGAEERRGARKGTRKHVGRDSSQERLGLVLFRAFPCVPLRPLRLILAASRWDHFRTFSSGRVQRWPRAALLRAIGCKASVRGMLTRYSRHSRRDSKACFASSASVPVALPARLGCLAAQGIAVPDCKLAQNLGLERGRRLTLGDACVKLIVADPPHNC